MISHVTVTDCHTSIICHMLQKYVEGSRTMIYTCHMQVHSSGKLHPRGDVTSKIYKPTFHGSHPSHNMSYGGAATLRIFYLP